MNDETIRSALRPLASVPVPDPPKLQAAGPEPSRFHAIPIVAAAAMLLVLWMVVASPFGVDPGAEESKIQEQLSKVESRLPEIEHEELRELLRREIELLRRELELAGGEPPESR